MNRRNHRHQQPAKHTPTVVEPNLDAVGASLTPRAKTLLRWLFDHQGEDRPLTESGLAKEDAERAFFELNDAGLVKLVPGAAAGVVVPDAVRSAMVPERYLVNMIGEMPEQSEAAEAWKTAAEAIAAYRAKWKITDASHALGGGRVVMHGAEQRTDAIAAWATIHEFRRIKAAQAPSQEIS